MLYGTPLAMKWTLDLIGKLEQVSGLKLNYKKMCVFAPNSAVAQACMELLPSDLEIKEDKNMNFVYLKSPIGSDDFVDGYLERKLARLREEIGMLSEMTHLHECFTLLSSCASVCKVTHLMRTIPPKQLSKFLDGFDKELRKAMEKIVRHDLSDNQ